MIGYFTKMSGWIWLYSDCYSEYCIGCLTQQKRYLRSNCQGRYNDEVGKNVIIRILWLALMLALPTMPTWNSRAGENMSLWRWKGSWFISHWSALPGLNTQFHYKAPSNIWVNFKNVFWLILASHNTSLPVAHI